MSCTNEDFTIAHENEQVGMRMKFLNHTPHSIMGTLKPINPPWFCSKMNMAETLLPTNMFRQGIDMAVGVKNDYFCIYYLWHPSSIGGHCNTTLFKFCYSFVSFSLPLSVSFPLVPTTSSAVKVSSVSVCSYKIFIGHI